MKPNGVSLASRLSAGVTLKDLEANALLAKTLGKCQATKAGTYDQDVQLAIFLGDSHGVRNCLCYKDGENPGLRD